MIEVYVGFTKLSLFPVETVQTFNLSDVLSKILFCPRRLLSMYHRKRGGECVVYYLVNVEKGQKEGMTMQEGD